MFKYKIPAWLFTVVSGIYFVIDFSSNAEFVIDKIQNPAWLKDFILLLDQPGWIRLIIFLLGVMWLSFIYWRVPNKKSESSTADLSKTENKLPDLRFEPKPIFQNLKTPKGTIKGLVAYLNITNKSQFEFYVTPRLRFSDSSGKVFGIEGVWSDRPLPETKTTLTEPMTFLAGQRHGLNIAVQLSGEATWYGIDNASPFVEYRYEKYKLTGTIKINLTLEGNIATVARYFQLKEEENGVITFDEV